MRQRGEGKDLEQWYSICSAHHDYDENCPRCSVGRWINVEESRLDRELFAKDPKKWRELHNRPDDPSRRFLESVFPGLKNSE